MKATTEEIQKMAGIVMEVNKVLAKYGEKAEVIDIEDKTITLTLAGKESDYDY